MSFLNSIITSQILRSIYRILTSIFGSPQKYVHAILLPYRLFVYFKDYISLLRQPKNEHFHTSMRFLYPCLDDRTLTTPVEPIYFFQDAWAAKMIFTLTPNYHIDIGSNFTTIGILSQYVPITMIDIRKPNVSLHNLSFKEGSILALPFEDNSVISISSLCVIEHIGLGRYGDQIDPWGSEKAAKELARVLQPGGQLLISVPMDSECRVYYNAHRTFTRSYLIDMFESLALIEEVYIYGNSTTKTYDPQCGFGTGLFAFTKQGQSLSSTTN